ncbi:MAG: hypothetical protein JNL51_11735 [Chitinophagaceae bacterium]|nr:hypothetical protein [Chitinophagaceae bacterium]
MLKILSRISVIIILFLSWFPDALGQPTLPADLKKPKKFENKTLGSEKSAEKKFTVQRRLVQNTVTRYNWYFNADNKLRQVVERAKLGHKDDFSTLLSFYNYSLDRTAQDKNELDSVVSKANIGILIHDLRNAWIDNLFMLIGQAYYYRKDLDSAYLTFQYINYAFSPKEKDGYDIPIGSNSIEGGSPLSVSTKESGNIIKKALANPPSRNEAFIWQIRTYIQRDMLPEAASLIQTLKNDPLFPERLSTDLNEVQALFFYNQNAYDSAAYYLERALGNASGREENARWEYLIAQLYEKADRRDLARTFYERAIKRTLDPVLDVYARLNAIKQNAADSAAIKKNIETLTKMGRKGRFTKYRDIIYYAAAQMELERNNIAGAKTFLLKSTAAAGENLNNTQRTKSFLLLGDLSFKERAYADAKRFYDSVNISDAGIPDPEALTKRKDALGPIVLQLDIIHRQDSLQALAAMPEAERLTLLKKMVRQYRKQQGLKEEETDDNSAKRMNNEQAPPTDLFASQSKGDWYFANPSLKSKGFNTFKTIWGNRANVDNWRRKADGDQAAKGMAQRGSGAAEQSDENSGIATVESLLQGIPLTPEKMELSNDSIGNAQLDLGILYISSLEEYIPAIEVLEQFTKEHIYSSRIPEALYYLYYCYQKTGREADAEAALQDMKRKYAGTKFERQLNNALTGEEVVHNAEVTRNYEHIYTLFIEGAFDEALALKKITDSAYGTTYWTPRLLYIESVYYLKQGMDAEAKKTLEKIIEVFPKDPLSARAQSILEVLGRRKEIEEYLTRLKIERINEDSLAIINEPTTARHQRKEPVIRPATDSAQRKPDIPNPGIKTESAPDTRTAPEQKDRDIAAAARDSSAAKQPAKDTPSPAPDIAAMQDSVYAPPGRPASAFRFTPQGPHYVIIVLHKVDPVYATESRNAFDRYNKENYYNTPIEITNQSLNDSIKLTVMKGFENAATALTYMEKTQAVAATRIIPWLPAGKYSFIIVSEQNLETLKANQDMDAYRSFLSHYYPDNFK